MQGRHTGIPLEQLIPAPLTTTTRFALAIRVDTSASRRRLGPSVNDVDATMWSRSRCSIGIVYGVKEGGDGWFIVVVVQLRPIQEDPAKSVDASREWCGGTTRAIAELSEECPVQEACMDVYLGTMYESGRKEGGQAGNDASRACLCASDGTKSGVKLSVASICSRQQGGAQKNHSGASMHGIDACS